MLARAAANWPEAVTVVEVDRQKAGEDVDECAG